MALGKAASYHLPIPDHCRYCAQGTMRDNDLISVTGSKGGISQFLFPEHSRSSQMRVYNLSSVGRLKAERESLNFSPNEKPFLPINRHVTWKFPFSSGVPIG